MTELTDLPVELLTRLAAAVAGIIDNGEMDYGLSLQHSRLLVPSKQHLQSLRALRSTCRMFSDVCTPHLFRVVKVLPTPDSAAQYTKILESDSLNHHVKKVVFQTRLDPLVRNDDWHDYGREEDEKYNDRYTEPHDFFLEAMEKMGRFTSLKSAELVFSMECAGKTNRWAADCLEEIEFREPVLEKFFKGLNHKNHPATGVHSLSIKHLQDFTPEALISTKENSFKTNFRQVMSRISHMSLQIATEYNDPAPENTLRIAEAHEFFGEELQKYWLGPIREQLTYLKLYSTEMLWGYFPRCDLPNFPNLETMILGNMSFTHDTQLEWILSHADKLKELIMDDCPIVVGATLVEHTPGPDRYLIRGQRPTYENFNFPTWRYDAHWHNHFDKLRTGLPNLKKFAYGHGPWDEGTALDEADSLTSILPKQTPFCNFTPYMYFDEGTGPSNWLEPEENDGFNGWMRDRFAEDEDSFVPKPDCDEEDQRALDKLLEEVHKRH